MALELTALSNPLVRPCVCDLRNGKGKSVRFLVCDDCIDDSNPLSRLAHIVPKLI